MSASLAPDRDAARTPAQVVELLAPDKALAQPLRSALTVVADAVSSAFPANIFMDLEYLATSLLCRAASAEQILRRADRIAALQHAFGQDTPIAFRYVHDFLYGYDWAKWVARDPDLRAAHEPFGAEFVGHMEERGAQLRAAIERGDDPKYPSLPPNTARNPFGFSREPEAEARLHRHLARAGLVPVEAWRVDATPDWRRPFAQLRHDAALELGLGV